MNQAHIIAEKLLEIKAVQINTTNPFTWASGILSPIYCDNRVILSYPKTRNFIKNNLVILANSLGKFDYVAGVATAGISFGVLLAQDLDLPFVYVRPLAKDHGAKNQIEGKIIGCPKVLIVEDLISTGGSSIKVLNVLRHANCRCENVISIFNYNLSISTDTFKSHNCKIDSLCDYERLIEKALIQEYINQEELDSLKSWRTNPETWKN